MFNIPALMRGPSGFQYPYEISQSCMFDLSPDAYTLWTPGGNEANEHMTLSFWMKRAKPGTRQIIMGTYYNASNCDWIEVNANDQLEYVNYYTSAFATQIQTVAKLRDTSGWYHIHYKVDGDDATAADRVKLWINGLPITDFGVSNWYDGGVTNYYWFYSCIQILGRFAGGGLNMIGNLAEVHALNGYAMEPTDFGQFKSGIWVPKAYTGSYGVNGWYMDFSNSAHLGEDQSGNNNDFTDNNLGTDHKLLDSPTNNHCILDFNNTRSNMTVFNEGGLRIQDSGGAWHNALGTFQMKTGKWYWEVDVKTDLVFSATGVMAAGERSGDAIISDLSINSNYVWAVECNGSAGSFKAYKQANGGVSDDNLAGPSNNDIMQVAYDADLGLIWYGVNDTWGDFGPTGVGNPAAGTNEAADLNDLLDVSLMDIVPFLGSHSNTVGVEINFGQRAFAHTPPTGFQSLCSANLPEPAILVSTKGYATKLYEGTGAELAISGIGFSPDLVALVRRNAATEFEVTDRVRGATKELNWDTTAVETTVAEGLKSFDADGFTLGTLSNYNASGQPFVAWCFKEAAKFGFDMVTYAGDDNAGRTVAHSLGVAPEMMWIKSITDDVGSWFWYHKAAFNKTDPATDYGLLDNGLVGWADLNTIWNDTAPDAANFTLGSHEDVNSSSDTYIAYLWASIPGFCKVFSYEGNGSTDGPVVNLGFRPGMMIYKHTSGAVRPRIVDTARNPFNGESILGKYPDLAAAEAGQGYLYDTLSNGFKIRSADSQLNTNGVIYVGIAFAEQPGKYANAR